MTNAFGIRRVKDVDLSRQSPFLIPGLIHETTTILFGRPKTQKSFLALSAAVALSEGTDWLGQPAEMRRVLFWALDNGQEDETTRRLREIDREGDLFISGIRAQDSDEWWDSFTEILVDTGIEVLVVDNLSGLLGGKSYNSDADVRPVLTRLQSVNDVGIAVILVHHSGKFNEEQGSQGKPMGSTWIEGWARHLIEVTKDGDLRILNVYGNNSPDRQIGVIVNPERNGAHGAFVTMGGQEERDLITSWEGDQEELAKSLWEQHQAKKQKQGRTTEQKARKATGRPIEKKQSEPRRHGIPEQIKQALADSPDGMNWSQLKNAVRGAAQAKSDAARSMVENGELNLEKRGNQSIYRIAD